MFAFLSLRSYSVLFGIEGDVILRKMVSGGTGGASAVVGGPTHKLVRCDQNIISKVIYFAR